MVVESVINIHRFITAENSSFITISTLIYIVTTSLKFSSEIFFSNFMHSYVSLFDSFFLDKDGQKILFNFLESNITMDHIIIHIS